VTDDGGGQDDDRGAIGAAQRAAWRAGELPPVERVRTDLWSIPVAIPNSPLRYTSVYVLAGAAGLTLVDAGTDTAQGWAALTAGLAVIGASVRDVTGCLVTHFHYDHLGLAARLQAEVGAWVGLHPADLATIRKPEYTDGAAAAAEGLRWLLRLGAPRADAERLRHAFDVPEHRAGIDRVDRLIEDGDHVEVDGWSLLAVHTPGHTPGHLCFHDRAGGLLFTGDHVLPKITPNIPADHGGLDALGDYLASLERIAGTAADVVLPAHEWRFTGLAARVAQLRGHHEERLAELLAAARAHPGSTPWQLAGELSWSRPWSEYDGTMRLAAVGETASHLVHLVRRGELAVGAGPVPRYDVVPVTGSTITAR
jgi:glyoxylase-like metal-dependent hydrolase (beta-lactamase superfamily II)